MSPKNTTAQKASQKYSEQAAPGKGEKGELETYLPLVKYIAGRLAIGLPRSVEMDDLINAGVVGLIEAYHNFDTGKGVKFETYASLRVRGSILDELRGMDWCRGRPERVPARSSGPSPVWKTSLAAHRRRRSWRRGWGSRCRSTIP